MASAIYVYCVVRRARRPACAHVPPGLPGASVPGVERIASGLWLVSSTVPLAEYGPEKVEPKLKDMEWVSRVALAHEGVVEHFLAKRSTSVVPMQLFTMFADAGRAAAEMRRRLPDIERVLDRVEGCEEWGVRVVRGAAPALREPARPKSGTEFLAERKQARAEAKAIVSGAAAAADGAFERLVRLSRAGRRRTPDAPRAAAPLLDAAFLVPTRSRARFHAAAERLARDVARHGAQMMLTGPWPPYNFIGEEPR